jgi:hypothetical protein
MDSWIKQGILKRRDTNGQQIHEEMLKFPGYKRDANQNNT